MGDAAGHRLVLLHRPGRVVLRMLMRPEYPRNFPTKLRDKQTKM